MLRKIQKGLFTAGCTVSVLMATSSPVLAASGRIMQTQGQYVDTATNLWIIAIKAVLFLMGIGAIGFAAWHLLQDYVLAKSDHEKKFSIGKLAVGAIVGSVLCYPGGAALIGGDLTGAGVDATVNQTDFKRGNNGGGGN